MEGGGNKDRLDLFLEKVSPVLSFSLVLFPFFMSFINFQLTIIYLAIIYSYFTYKSASIAIFFALSLYRMRNANYIDWNKLIEGLRDIDTGIKDTSDRIKEMSKYNWKEYCKTGKGFYTRLTNINDILNKNKKLPLFFQKIIFKRLKSKNLYFLKQELKVLKSLHGKKVALANELQHIVIIPHVKEPESILRDTLNHLKNQTINTKLINIVLAAEAADPDGVVLSEKLKTEFSNDFNNIWITNHKLQPDEIVGKSSNMNWASRSVYKIIKAKGWDLKKTTITSCDVDSKLDPRYFSYLTYKYIATEDSEYKFYTSAILFYNNIWRLPFYARVKNSLHSIFQTSNLSREDRLIPFSTYTASFWILEQIGFWDPWVTPEDYHLFFKAIFKFNNKVMTVPLFLKTLSDAAEGEGHWETIRNNYLQSRRWAWGVSDDGWVIKNFLKNFFKSSFRSKYITLHMLFDHIMGLVVAFLILLGGILPGMLGYINSDFNNYISGALFPTITGQFVQLTVVFLLITIFLDFYLRPTPVNFPWWKNLTRIIEWAVQPLAGFFLTAVPSLEAQARLFFGKYLEYYLTKKKGS